MGACNLPIIQWQADAKADVIDVTESGWFEKWFWREAAWGVTSGVANSDALKLLMLSVPTATTMTR